MKKYTRKKVEVICCSCENLFVKDESEVKRNKKIGRNNFCSISCSKKTPKNLEMLSNMRINISYIPTYKGDEYSPFKPHLLRAKRRNSDTSITLEDLKNIWEEQKGICPYSKVKLSFTKYSGRNNPIYSMSLDRKNSNLGYIKENIQFISIAMNLMKNSMSEEEMQEILMILRYPADM